MDRKIDKSLTQKTVFAAIHFGAILVSFWVLFLPGQELVFAIFGQPGTTVSTLSKIVIFSSAFLYFVRHIFTLFVLLKREVQWNEVFGVAPFVAIIQIMFAVLTIYHKINFNPTDWIFIGLVILGSYLNTGSEWQRMVWKQKAVNKGKLYTKGLFKYSMHINYFGDTVLFTGFALLTGCYWALSVPVFITLGFLFYHIPELDNYLINRYKEQFTAYKSKTKIFAPWIY